MSSLLTPSTDLHKLTQRFKKRCAIITGGSSGIGQSVAIRLAEEGAIVNILDINKAKQTLKLISEKCNNSKNSKLCKSYIVDVTSLNSVRNTIKEIAENNNYKIDCVVNSAGIAGNPGIISHLVTNENIINVMNINFIGTINLCKAVLPFMLKNNYGRIVNIASISGKEGNPGQLAYASSKGAVIAATKTMGKDYSKTGITINSIAPAVIETEMVRNIPKTQYKMMVSKIPMNRCGTLYEIAGIIAFMCSQENSFSTGFCFDMTGGRATY